MYSISISSATSPPNVLPRSANASDQDFTVFWKWQYFVYSSDEAQLKLLLIIILYVSGRQYLAWACRSPYAYLHLFLTWGFVKLHEIISLFVQTYPFCLERPAILRAWSDTSSQINSQHKCLFLDHQKNSRTCTSNHPDAYLRVFGQKVAVTVSLRQKISVSN